MWAILAFGTAILTSFNPILYKRILKNVDPLIVIWVVNLLGLPLLAIFTWVLTPKLPELDWVYAIAVLASAGLNVIAHLANTRALQKEDVSLVTPFLIFTPVFTLVTAALALNERPSLRGLIGVGLVLIGAYWLNRSPRTGWQAPFRSLTLKPGVLLVLMAGLLWAITPVIEKLAIQHTIPENPRLTAFSIETMLVLLLTYPALARKRLSMKNLAIHRRELLLAGLISGSAPILGYTALSLGLVGYVTTLFKLSTVLTVIWAAWLLKEGGLRQRLPASLMMVIGAILISA